jgi:hypothetical protein
MADVIGLVNDISASVKFAWIGVLVWAAIQIIWYRRGRVPAGAVEPVAAGWSAGFQVPSVTRPPETTLLETDSTEAPALYLFRADGVAEDVDADSGEETPGIASGSDELAEFLETGRPRRRAGRRRRSSAGGVLALDTPKAT